MSKRSATGKDSSTLGDRRDSVATMEGKPRKGRRSGESGKQGVVSNPFGLVPIERFELKPIIRTCSMDLLYRGMEVPTRSSTLVRRSLYQTQGIPNSECDGLCLRTARQPDGSAFGSDRG